MRCSVAALVAAFLFLASCSTTPALFKPYRACFEEMEGGRMLHDPGVVVREFDDEAGHWFVFRGTFWPHEIPVRRVNRMCSVAAAQAAIPAVEESRYVPQ